VQRNLEPACEPHFLTTIGPHIFMSLYEYRY